MNNAKEYYKPKLGSERGFGIVFSILFSALTIYFFFEEKNIYTYVFGSLSLTFILFTVFSPDSLKPLNKVWFKFGISLGKVMSPLILLVAYVAAVIPMKILLVLFKKDLLSLKIDKKRTSYWLDKDNNVGTMKDQY